MAEVITIIRMWCSVCDTFTWHLHGIDGKRECLQCRSQDLEDALKDSFAILAQ
ncbi:hypothetical protein ES708_16765 [subsurface metagenome]